MALHKLEYECQHCGYVAVKWQGQCNDCKHWNSFLEIKKKGKEKKVLSKKVNTRGAQNITEIKVSRADKVITGLKEFDRVMGNGLTIGSLNLIGGEPGVGKSTLILEVIGSISKSLEKKCLYISAEESESQVLARAKRLGAINKNIYLLHETILENILTELDRVKPEFIVLDSIQTIVLEGLSASAGSVSQIREITYEVMNYCKQRSITAFIIGHVTKEGGISGPKLLEHMVDTVLYFEGNKNNQHRVLRTIKNRYGNTFEVGVFEMNENGLSSVLNPSHFFLDENGLNSYGKCRTCIIEGSRILFVEIQALVNENKFGNIRRVTQGIDSNRLAMLVAVIEKYFEIPLALHDVYINIAGGVKVASRDIDLAIITCILSSYFKKSILNNSIFIGEVGLTGEVQAVSLLDLRLREILLHNYKKVVLSEKSGDNFAKYSQLRFEKVIKVNSLTEFC